MTDEGSTARRLILGSSALCTAIAIAGFILAWRFSFPATLAIPVVAAFCLQAALYCTAVSGLARGKVRNAIPARFIAPALVIASISPYLVYSVPTGVFSPESLAKLILLCSGIAYPYVLIPVRKHRFAWQDAVVICALAYPMISGLSTMFRDVYQGFDPPANRLDALGKLMLIPLGLFVFLELRRLRRTGFRLLPSRKDWRHALKISGYSVPWILFVGITSGYLQWDPPVSEPLRSLVAAIGKLVGIYFTTALAEEFLLRGVVQNLAAASTGRPLLAQGISALIFGAVHLGRGGFPNVPYAATASVLGWFCGSAYARSGTVTAAMIVHALAVAGQELFFR